MQQHTILRPIAKFVPLDDGVLRGLHNVAHARVDGISRTREPLQLHTIPRQIAVFVLKGNILMRELGCVSIAWLENIYPIEVLPTKIMLVKVAAWYVWPDGGATHPRAFAWTAFLGDFCSTMEPTQPCMMMPVSAEYVKQDGGLKSTPLGIVRTANQERT